MHGSKVKILLGVGVVAVAVAAAALLLVEGDDGSDASGPGIDVGAGIVAVQPDDPGESAAKTAGIVGGVQVTTEQYPWQVAITLAPSAAPGNARARQICGGTLLAPTIVVTAAHCVYDTKKKRFMDPSDFSVVSGRTKLSSNQGVESEISDYHYFTDTETNRPLYSPGIKDWDVVVMVLPAPVIGTPVPIAGPDEAESWAPGTTARVSGWGSVDDGRPGSYPDKLRATDVTIFGPRRCARAFDYDRETSFCAGDVTGARDTCVGDSGGPVMITASDGTARLVGATSFGPNDCGNAALPGFYTRLADDPIRSSIGSLVQQLAGVDVVG